MRFRFPSFFRKKELLREAIQKEAALAEELKKDYKDRRLSQAEYRGLMERWKQLAPVLRILMPPAPFTRKELYRRLGIAGGAVLILLIAVGAFVKITYFPHGLSSFSFGEGGTGTYRHIPEQLVRVSDFPSALQISRSDLYNVARFENLDGKVVTLYVEENRQVHLIYTHENADGQFSLYRRAFDYDLIQLQTKAHIEEQKIPIDGNIIDASVVREKERFVVAYVLSDAQKQSHFYIQAFTLQWQPVGPAIAFNVVDALETSGVSLVAVDTVKEVEREIPIAAIESAPTATGTSSAPPAVKKEISREIERNYYLVTAKAYDRRKESASNATVPILRQFNSVLNTVKAEVLKTQHLSLDTHMAVQPKADGNGFFIVANGRNPLDAGSAIKGDELFVLEYDKNWELQNIIRATNNGTPHDFWPSQVIAEGATWLIPYQQVQRLPQKEGEDNGYPKDAGKVFVMGLKNQNEVIGTFFAADYNARRPGGDRLEGGRNTRIAKAGTRIFIAHDGIIEEDVLDKDDGAYRIVRLQWIDTNLAASLEKSPMTTKETEEKRAPVTESETVSKEEKKVKILSTPTGWLRVRNEPSLFGKEVAKVDVGEQFVSTELKNGWYKILLPDGTHGWIFGEYAREISQ